MVFKTFYGIKIYCSCPKISRLTSNITKTANTKSGGVDHLIFMCFFFKRKLKKHISVINHNPLEEAAENFGKSILESG